MLLTALGLGYTRSVVAMLVVDDESVVVHANPAAGALLDAPPTGRELVDVLGDGTPLPPVGEVQEVSLQTTAGRSRHAEVCCDPFRGPSGESLLLVQLRDVTADRARSEELQESHQLVRQLLDADPDSVVLTFDTSLRLVTASASLPPSSRRTWTRWLGGACATCCPRRRTTSSKRAIAPRSRGSHPAWS